MLASSTLWCLSPSAYQSGFRDHQTIGATLPWLGLDTVDCELNSFCYLIQTSHTRNNLPPCAPCRRSGQLGMRTCQKSPSSTSWSLTGRRTRTFSAQLRTMQSTWLTTGTSRRFIDCKPSSPFTYLRQLIWWIALGVCIAAICSCARITANFSAVLRRIGSTPRIMEWIASRDPSMAGPFHLLLRPEDLQPDAHSSNLDATPWSLKSTWYNRALRALTSATMVFFTMHPVSFWALPAHQWQFLTTSRCPSSTSQVTAIRVWKAGWSYPGFFASA